jgi:hypothetical protein
VVKDQVALELGSEPVTINPGEQYKVEYGVDEGGRVIFTDSWGRTRNVGPEPTQMPNFWPVTAHAVGARAVLHYRLVDC